MSSDSEELRAHIEETRAELAGTVEALSAKADVKGRAQAKAHELGAQARVQADSARTYAVQESKVAREQITRTQAEKPWLFPAAGGVALVGLISWFFVRRRNS